MKERPILFSTDMVRAIIEGKKTMTRRVVKKTNSIIGPGGSWDRLNFNGQAVYKDTPLAFDLEWLEIYRQAPLPWSDGKPETGQYLHVPYNWSDDMTVYRVYPKWEVGGRLWVRETWWEQSGDIYYKADWEQSAPVNMVLNGNRWKPSISMPRWASRILLEITEIRAQKLQEITEEDCYKEGIADFRSNFPDIAEVHHPINSYHSLWDSLNGKKYPWLSNPWCWVLRFKKVERNKQAAEKHGSLLL